MTVKSNFPEIRPSLNLDFANVKALDPRITFTRTTTATYYDGKTTAKAEENLLLQSQTFNSTWVVSQTSVTADTEVAPDGTTTAETITDNAVSAPHIVQQGISLQANTEYVFSCFLKEGTNTHAYLSIRDTGTAQRYFAADFDLNGGTVRTSTAGSSGTLTSATITSVGNGWYRCVLIGQVSVAVSMFATIGVSDGSSSFSTFGSIAYAGTSTTIYAWGAQLEQRSAVTAYTPTTTQTITNYIPVLQTAASGVARFDHNPTTGESLGLLVEEQRTNLLTYSSEFDNAAWTKNSSTATSNTIVAPDGTLTGDKLVGNGGTNTFLSQSIATTAQSYALTVYAKKGELNWTRLTWSTNTTNTAWFNLNTGALGTVRGGTATMTLVGNGWYRCSFVFTATATTVQTIVGMSNADDTTTGYTGNSWDGIYIWGAQLEAGAFPTSYIATTSATVTRNADAASMTGTNFSSWFNSAEGTMYGSWSALTSSVARIATFNDGTQNNALSLTHTGSLFGGDTYVNNAYQGVVGPSKALVASTEYKSSYAYQVNNGLVAGDGVAGTTDTNVLIPVVNQFLIGIGRTGTSYHNGHIKKLSYYPSRLSNAQLQALTT